MSHRRSSSRSSSPLVSFAAGTEHPAPLTPWLVALTDMCLAGAIVLVPCCFEGRTPVGRLLLTLFGAGALLAWSLHQLTSAERQWRWSGSEWLWIAGLALAGFQLTALSAETLAAWSPKLAGFLPAWADPALQPLFPQAWRTLSVTPSETWSGLSVYVALGMLFLAAMQRLRDQVDLERLLKGSAVAAVGMSAFGLAQFALSNDLFFWVWPHPHARTSSYVMASFPNRNHAAHYFVLGVGPLLWWFARSLSGTSKTSKKFDGSVITGFTWGKSQFVLLGGLGVVMLATVLTLSRGGLAALALATLVALVGLCRAGCLPWRLMLSGVAAAAVGLCAVAAGNLDTLLDRVQQEGNDIRTPIWAANVAVARDFPWFGTGLGSHAEVYHPYLDATYDGTEYTHAESSYLQVVTEMGYLGLGIALLMTLLLMRWTMSVALARQDRALAAMGAALLASLSAHLLHAAVDFLWYVPGLMSVVAVQAAAACRLRQLQRRAVTGRDADRPAGAGWWLLVSAATAAVAIAAVHQQWPAVSTSAAWDAYRFFAFAPPLDPDDPGTAELEQERLRDELRQLMIVVKRDPGNTQASLVASQALLLLFDQKQLQTDVPLPLEQLRDTVRTAKMKTPQEVRQWMQRAVGANLKLLDASWNLALRTVRQNPCEGMAYLNLARLSFLHDPSGAMQRALLNQALVIRPYNPTVLLAAADQAFFDGDERAAIGHWQEAFRRGGPYPQKIIEALAPAKSAEFLLATFNPDYTQVGMIVSAFEKLGRDDELPDLRAAYAERALQYAQSHAGEATADLAWSAAAENYRLLQDRPRMMNVLEEGCRAQPHSPLLHSLLGRAFYDEGRFHAAAEHLRTALRHSPDDDALRDLADLAARHALRGRSNIRRASHSDGE